AQQPPSVTFLVPNQPGEQPFWTHAIEIMQAAADDLGIDFKVVYSKAGSYNHKKDGLAILNSRPPPDYLLSLYLIEATPHHLKLAEKLGVSTFIFNAGVTAEDREDLGGPRARYRHWIGQMVPHDREAGYLLADTLIAQAKKAGKTDETGKVRLISVGAFGASVDESRDAGLKNRIREHDDARLDKTVLTGWSATIAYDETLEALQEYPQTGAIWCVSDATALGALRAAKASGKTPGRDIFIGGIDWSLDGLKAVAAGEMAVTVGGHILEGAQALILIYDYHHGIDFAEGTGAEMQTAMKAVTAGNAEGYLHRLYELDWRKIDFKRFSKKHNPGLKDYDFSLDALLESESEIIK
ncbi:MAG TPA: ABC transporter substrate-binding protein, partial [Gammaproteobacteria bacterium]